MPSKEKNDILIRCDNILSFMTNTYKVLKLQKCTLEAVKTILTLQSTHYLYTIFSHKLRILVKIGIFFVQEVQTGKKK